jgi:monoamine oxidase
MMDEFILFGMKSSILSASECSPHNRSQCLDVLVPVLDSGMAGIRAGRLLTDAGVAVTILEGRSRIGGRLWSDRSLGYANDLGASWV